MVKQVVFQVVIGEEDKIKNPQLNKTLGILVNYYLIKLVNL